MIISTDLQEGQQVKLTAAVLDKPIYGKVVIEGDQVTVHFINWRNEISIIRQKPTRTIENGLDWYNIEIVS